MVGKTWRDSYFDKCAEVDHYRARIDKVEGWNINAARLRDEAEARCVELERALKQDRKDFATILDRIEDVEGIEAAIYQGEKNHEISHDKGESYRSCAARAVIAHIRGGG
jgi:hypothetical protein